jgi:hypothetical protein
VTDLGALATNWQSTGASWEMGDFNADGMVDVTDLGSLATNWQQSSLSFSAALAQVGLSNIPEPAELSLLLVGLAAISRRRGRTGA